MAAPTSERIPMTTMPDGVTIRRPVRPHVYENRLEHDENPYNHKTYIVQGDDGEWFPASKDQFFSIERYLGNFRGTDRGDTRDPTPAPDPARWYDEGTHFVNRKQILATYVGATPRAWDYTPKVHNPFPTPQRLAQVDATVSDITNRLTLAIRDGRKETVLPYQLSRTMVSQLEDKGYRVIPVGRNTRITWR